MLQEMCHKMDTIIPSRVYVSRASSRMFLPTKLVQLALLGAFCFVAVCTCRKTKSLSLLLPLANVQSDFKDEHVMNVTFQGANLSKNVHTSPFPAKAAGQWIYQPDQVQPPSHSYLKCLNQERHGNCHNSPTISAKQPRKRAVLNGFVHNSPGMFTGMDPYMWESNLTDYKISSDYNSVQKLIKNRKFFLIGDSLTRQWRQSLLCEFQHLLHMTQQEAKESVHYLKLEKEFPDPTALQQFIENATDRDYLIFNMGHHIDAGHMGKKWPRRFQHEISKARVADFGNIRHVYFRTTCVRHFLSGHGDYNTSTYNVGGYAPNEYATWSSFGGNFPETLPTQNLLALDILSDSTIEILDVSPMMLARGDASFDGTHFCMPGPIDYWSKMLYYRIQVNEARGF